MKAIIIAAGIGSRLGGLTEDKPKCLLQINGKSIINHQIDAFYANGIMDIAVIKGYLAELIDVANCSYYINDDYRNNNVLVSLMYAEDAFDSGFISTNSDVIFSKNAICKIKDEPCDISILMDTNWLENYVDRKYHPISEAETVICSDNGELIEIGKNLKTNRNFSGEFVGILKCSAKGSQVFKESFNKAKSLFDGKPFIRAESFQQAYITDMLQHMTNEGIKINCVPINGECFEIDTEEDYQKVSKILSKV